MSQDIHKTTKFGRFNAFKMEVSLSFVKLLHYQMADQTKFAK